MEGLEPRKTRVFALPGARKNMKMSPGTLVKYNVSAGKTVFLLELAAFGGSKMQPNRAKTLCSQLKPCKIQRFEILLIFRAFGASWAKMGPRSAPGGRRSGLRGASGCFGVPRVASGCFGVLRGDILEPCWGHFRSSSGSIPGKPLEPPATSGQ